MFHSIVWSKPKGVSLILAWDDTSHIFFRFDDYFLRILTCLDFWKKKNWPMLLSLENIVITIFFSRIYNLIVSELYYHLPFLSNFETKVYWLKALYFNIYQSVNRHMFNNTCSAFVPKITRLDRQQDNINIISHCTVYLKWIRLYDYIGNGGDRGRETRWTSASSNPS